MSAYFCSPETFSKVAVSFLEAIEKHEFRTNRVYTYDQLIKELQELNNLSLLERYGDKGVQPVIEKIPKLHCFTLKQNIEELKEYLYQCSEGKAMDQKLYKTLRKFEVSLLNKFYYTICK